MSKPVGRVLLTNDDGIAAEGLVVLEAIAREIAEEIWVVAPASEQSGASHSLSLQGPLDMQKLAPRRYSVSGTPTDCVLLAVRALLADTPPDLVLSGVNAGQNLAEDIGYSGTVAGAMEGAVCGLRAIALSQGYDFDTAGGTFTYDNPRQFGAEIICRLLAKPWPPDTLFNVNFPTTPLKSPVRYALTRQGKRDMRHLQIRKLESKARTTQFQYYFDRAPSKPQRNTDLAAFHRGEISITPLHTNITNHEARAQFETLFDDM